MPFKRIIAVLAVRESQLVKSIGYARWRPAGGLVSALRNLDRWGADEIVVLDISRRGTLDPKVLDQIHAARVATPLAYGGGIRGTADVHRLMELGCDRFVVESLLFEKPEELERIAQLAGQQALIASLPIIETARGPSLWRPETTLSWEGNREHLLCLPVSEYFVTAVEAEGGVSTFPLSLTRSFADFPKDSVIWFGGLDPQLAKSCLALPQTVGVAWGNLLHERELALPLLRRRLLRSGPRPMRLA